MQNDGEAQVRAWVEYYRDLGVYDFYRLGEPPRLSASEDSGEVLMQPAAAATAVSCEGRAPTAEIAPVAKGELHKSFPIDRTPAPRIPETLPMPPAKLISFNDLAPLPAAAIAAADREAALLAIQEEIGDCTRCPLAYAGRRKIVFGDGSPTARLLFVGEGPGADEDTQGIPFVGKAGQLLNNMIGAMGLSRAEVYIANIVKCRPPSNRVPEATEANTCTQFLLRQIDVVQPEVIVALGATAATYLLGVKESLGSLRGRWHACRGAKLVVTYHPAFLLRDPRQKAEAWKDLQMAMVELGLTAAARKESAKPS
jgi:DNA polymerase